jgi:hypothetical protein
VVINDHGLEVIRKSAETVDETPNVYTLRTKLTSKTTLDKFIDAASDTITYIGYKNLSDDASAAVFKIKRILIDGTVTKITWAEGTDTFSLLWANRATYDYGD